eukprot:SAG31_NODE_7716_length_1610_cov_1.464593_1_plen_447_part_10
MGLREALALALLGAAILPCGAASERPLLSAGITSDRTGTIMEFGFLSSSRDATQLFRQLNALASLRRVSNHTLALWPEASSWLPLARSHAAGLLTSVGPPEMDRATRAHRLRSMLMDAMTVQNRVMPDNGSAHAHDATPLKGFSQQNAQGQHVVQMANGINGFEAGGESHRDSIQGPRIAEYDGFALTVNDVADKAETDSIAGDHLFKSKLDSNRRLQGAARSKACDGNTRPERLAGKSDGLTTTLDFTGGYANDMDCAWMLSCEGGNATALRFTSLETESNFDFVSLFDEDGHKITRGNGVSGSAMPSRTYMAKDGVMEVGFHSDFTGSTGDGFAAEYWCVDGAAVGCTDTAATNYEPHASVDDGSCTLPDTDPQGSLLREAFGVVPANSWGSLSGWGPGENPCDYGANGSPWEGVSCTNGVVTRVVVSNHHQDLMGELCPGLSNL